MQKPSGAPIGISVIIPTVGKGPHLATCIASVLGQAMETFRLELIVVFNSTEDLSKFALPANLVSRITLRQCRERNRFILS